MTSKKITRLVIIILAVLAIALIVRSFMNNPHFSDVPEGSVGTFITGEIDEVKFTTSIKPAIYQLFREESGIRVEKFNRLGGFRVVMKCKGIDEEWIGEDNFGTIKLKECGPGKKDINIDRVY